MVDMKKQYWAMFDAAGLPVAFYVSDIWPEQPSDTIEITEDQWREFIDNPSLRKWLDGGVVEYVPPAVSQVLIATPWQVRKALNQLGLRDDVESYVSGASQDVKDAWEFATQFERNHPFIVACGAALGKSDAEIDALFQLAVTL